MQTVFFLHSVDPPWQGVSESAVVLVLVLMLLLVLVLVLAPVLQYSGFKGGALFRRRVGGDLI